MGGRSEGKGRGGCEVPGLGGGWITGSRTELRNKGWREILKVATVILVLCTRRLNCLWDTHVCGNEVGTHWGPSYIYCRSPISDYSATKHYYYYYSVRTIKAILIFLIKDIFIK